MAFPASSVFTLRLDEMVTTDDWVLLRESYPNCVAYANSTVWTPPLVAEAFDRVLEEHGAIPEDVTGLEVGFMVDTDEMVFQADTTSVGRVTWRVSALIAKGIFPPWWDVCLWCGKKFYGSPAALEAHEDECCP